MLNVSMLHKVKLFFVQKKANTPHGEKDVIASIIAAVKLAFSECHGDFDNPSKESLEQVVKFLAERAATWGTPKDIIDHHASQMHKVIGRL